MKSYILVMITPSIIDMGIENFEISFEFFSVLLQPFNHSDLLFHILHFSLVLTCDFNTDFHYHRGSNSRALLLIYAIRK